MVLDLFSGLDMRANRMSIQENAEALFRVPRRSKLFGHYQLQDIACATDITRFWWLVNALSWQPTERTIQYNVLLLHIAFKLNIMDIERDMKRVSNRIYRAFYPGIHTDKTICYAVITEEDEQQLLDRMRPGLESVGRIFNHWWAIRSGSILGSAGGIENGERATSVQMGVKNGGPRETLKNSNRK
jgi:hypothetical protein